MGFRSFRLVVLTEAVATANIIVEVILRVVAAGEKSGASSIRNNSSSCG